MEQEEFNPYAAPQSPGVAPELAAPNAGMGKRFLNLLLDSLVVIGVLAGVMVFFVVFDARTGRSRANSILATVESFMNLNFLPAICFVGYYTLCEGLFGRSLGKLVTGTKVVTLWGGPPPFSIALARSFIRLLPFEPFSFFGDGFGNGEGRGWHDKWTDTRVVDLRAKPAVKTSSIC